MVCNQCNETTNRKLSLVGTVTKMKEKRIILEITEPQERLMSVDGGKPFAFPFWLREGETELVLCSLNCLRRYISEQQK